MAAARAGGILANSTYQKDFFLENIEIQNSLLKLALEKKSVKTAFAVPEITSSQPSALSLGQFRRKP